jgi:endonuclease-3
MQHAEIEKRREAMAKGGENHQERKKRARRILNGLRKLYPEADCALRHADPVQLLIATILSAQSTDETVNKVTPVLFGRFKTVKALAEAPLEQIEEIIHSTGFFRQKAKSVKGVCRKIVGEHSGKVPDSMDELITLPGVARKTANVVLGTAFGKNEGFVVDTHVGRLATRLRLTWSSKNDKDAVKIERDLMELFPRKQWTFLGHALIWHGRRVCSARKPDCLSCTLARNCPSAGTFDKKPAGRH